MTDDNRVYLTAESLAERDAEVSRLAHEIADEATRSDIEGFCPAHAEGGQTWYFTILPADAYDAYDRMTVERAVRYLELREKLEHHSTQAALVRCKG